MESKLLEIRDIATLVPVLCTSISKTDGWLARHAGFGARLIMVTQFSSRRSFYDPFEWVGSRTMQVAHDYIQRNWDTIKNEDAIDVEYILGGTKTPKTSQAYDSIY